MINQRQKLNNGKRTSVGLIVMILVFSWNVLGQKATSLPKPQATPKPVVKVKVPVASPAEVPEKVSPIDNLPSEENINQKSTPAEKSIETDEKVVVSLCVSQGKVKINGWGRNEVRAFVEGGSSVGFDIRQKHKQSAKPTLLAVVSGDSSKNKNAETNECLFGENIEVDVPRNAVIQIKSGESEILIDSVARVRVENATGDINLNNISGGIEAKTYEGDILAEKSSGEIHLMSGTGNIIVFEVTPNDLGESFRAKSGSGSITLQSIEHNEVEVNSITGIIRYIGSLVNGGKYSFGTTNGSILLSINDDSSCKILASFGFGSFQSEIPLKEVVKVSQRLSAVLGTGKSSLNITTSSGTIRIKPLKKKN